MQRADVERKLRTFIESSALEIVAAYLFGSVARDEHGVDSDVDVAILVTTEPPATLAHPSIRLAADLEQALGRPVQVVVLNRAPADLVHRVLRDGRIIVDRDPARRIHFEVKARNEYFDLLPILQRYRRAPGAGS